METIGGYEIVGELGRGGAGRAPSTSRDSSHSIDGWRSSCCRPTTRSWATGC